MLTGHKTKEAQTVMVGAWGVPVKSDTCLWAPLTVSDFVVLWKLLVDILNVSV